MFTRFSCKSSFDITLNDPTLPSSPFSDRIPRVTVERDKDAALEELSVGVSRPVARRNLRVLLANDDPRAGSRLDIRFWPIVLTVYKVQIFFVGLMLRTRSFITRSLSHSRLRIYFIFSCCAALHEDRERRVCRRECRRGVVCAGRAECSRVRVAFRHQQNRHRHLLRCCRLPEFRYRSLPAGGHREALVVVGVVRERREQLGAGGRCARRQRAANDCARGAPRAARRPRAPAAARRARPAVSMRPHRLDSLICLCAGRHCAAREQSMLTAAHIQLVHCTHTVLYKF